jgi:hypothetical protein
MLQQKGPQPQCLSVVPFWTARALAASPQTSGLQTIEELPTHVRADKSNFHQKKTLASSIQIAVRGSLE